MPFNLTYKPFGNKAILIEWPAKIEKKIIEDIIHFENKIPKTKAVLDTIIGYNSLTICYVDELTNFKNLVSELEFIYTSKKKNVDSNSILWEIPVCYDTEFGIDLEELSKEKNLSIQEIIKLHTLPNYLIYFIGFQPGFPYLGGLDKKLHTPRKSNPRLRVAKGSVGIGGKQTGVYPQDSSGGWNIIGKSPIDFFNCENKIPCFFKAGDRIKIYAVDINEFNRIEKEVENGKYKLKSK